MGNVKLLARLRAHPAGVTGKEVRKLYLSFGFEQKRKGKRSKHDQYFHPEYPHLVATVTRASGEISVCYAEDAVELIDELERLQEIDRK